MTVKSLQPSFSKLKFVCIHGNASSLLSLIQFLNVVFFESYSWENLFHHLHLKPAKLRKTVRTLQPYHKCFLLQAAAFLYFFTPTQNFATACLEVYCLKMPRLPNQQNIVYCIALLSHGYVFQISISKLQTGIWNRSLHGERSSHPAWSQTSDSQPGCRGPRVPFTILRGAAS